MVQTLGHDDLVRMLRRAAAKVRESHEQLSKLDSFGGAGHHVDDPRRDRGTFDAEGHHSFLADAGEDELAVRPGRLR